MTVFDAWMFGDLFAWSDAIEATRAIPYQWYPTETMHEWAGAMTFGGGTRGDIAFALLLVPGAVAVGIADQNDDPRIEPYFVELCLRWDPLSMVNDPSDGIDWDLLEREVRAQLYQHLPAGIAYHVVYELVV